MVIMKIPTLFKSDSNGIAIPELNTDMQWVLGNPKTFISIMLEGVALEVKWGKTEWELHALATNSIDPYLITKVFPQDKAIVEAFERQTTRSTGTFIAYGKGIWGNGHKLNDAFLMRLAPLDGNLIVQKAKTKIKMHPHVTVKDFYDSVKEELAESPEIYGLVFFLEDQFQKQTQMAKVRQKDMGLEWPRQTAQTIDEHQYVGMGMD